MLLFSPENLLKTATLQNLDSYLLKSKILSVTQISEHTPVSKFILIKIVSLYTFNKRNSHEISISFCSDNYIL